MKIDWVDYVLVTMVAGYTIIAPFTKVEESFNLQAVHDMLFHGTDLSQYDHFNFPGVVPRTFIGALTLSIFCKPIQLIMGSENKFDMQLMTRGVLGLINGYSLAAIRHTAVKTCNINKRGKLIGYWFMLFQIIQFHVVFYASRTLPNMLAMPLTNLAICQVLEGYFPAALSTLAFASIVFRSELIVLTGSLALTLLLLKKISFISVIKRGLQGVGLGGMLSLAIDSYFWQRPMIPEVVGFIFNVVQGQSDQWGVEPIYSYFTVHLPNMITNPILLGVVPIGLFQDSTGRNSLRILGFSSLLFVGIYSLLPHKEWRFVVYIMPILSLLCANATAAFVYERRNKFLIYKILPAFLILTSIASFGVSFIKLGISANNYPGGQALMQFNQMAVNETAVVHLDVPTCMTGASKFAETVKTITYDKTEDEQELAKIWPTFDYLITSHSTSDAFPTVSGYEWEKINTVNGFKSFNSKFVKEQVDEVFEDTYGYFEDLVYNLRRVSSFHESMKELWNKVIETEPQIFVYKKTRV